MIARTGDPITDLGFAMKREIPKGRTRVEWMAKTGVLEEVTSALRGIGYSGNHLARALFDLSLGEIRLPLVVDSADALAALRGDPA